LNLLVKGVLMGIQDFVMHFLTKALFQDMEHINDFGLSWEMHKLFWASFLHMSFVDLLILFRQFFFLLPSYFFYEFWQENYVGMWGHYGSKFMGVYSRPLSEVSNSTIDLLWWYMPFIYGRLCPICFFKELWFGGSIFVLQVLYFQ